MPNIIFTNNASALLAATINSTALSIQVAAGYGANFPSPSGDQYFYLALEDDAGTIEYVKITGRANDILTMDSVADRGQDGTSAISHTLNTTRCELRVIKSTMEEFLQQNGGAMTGDLDMNGNNLIDAYLTGSATRMLNGQIVNVPLRGLLDTSTNEIAVPVDGTSRATAGGAALLAVGDDVVAELDTAGVIILDSATVGVRILDGAYLRVEGATAANHMSVAHDDTDCNFTFPNTTEVNWDTLFNLAANLRLNDNDLIRPNFVDFSVKTQTRAAAGTLNVNYELGSYVTITMGQNITTLNFVNPPTTEVGVFRLKFVQDGTGGWTAPFAGILFAGGAAPSLSTAADAIDFVDVWTDDGGTTWYGAYNNAWA